MKYKSRAFADLIDTFPYKDIVDEAKKQNDKWETGLFWSEIGYVLQPALEFPDENLVKDTIINRIIKDSIIKTKYTETIFTTYLDTVKKGENLNIKISDKLDYISVEYFNVKFIIDYRKKKKDGTK